MKRLLLLFGALALTAFTGCDNDKSSSYHPDEAVEAAFDQQYPGAEGVRWGRNGAYAVADFRKDGRDASAWYTPDGKWQMTETDLTVGELPDAVRTAFATDYPDWRAVDAERIERSGLETIYEIEAERGERELEVWYSPAGVKLGAKEELDSDDDHTDWLPQTIPAPVSAFITQNYPNARIVDFDDERTHYEAEIVDDRTARTLYFDRTYRWTATESDIRLAEVPQIVLDALRNTAYGTWEIDDVEYWQTPESSWYAFELEHNDREVDVRIAPTGEVLP